MLIKSDPNIAILVLPILHSSSLEIMNPPHFLRMLLNRCPILEKTREIASMMPGKNYRGVFQAP